jgi:CTD small phosphatase-like protein 2
LSHFYEIVIFTAGVEEYANWVVDQLDPDGTVISHRLYRQHTINRSKT